MKKFIAHSLIALAAFSSVHAFAQGALTPSGPPAPSMKSLAQVEPRTPVNSTTTPGNATSAYVIAQPGSYYLEGNIAVSTVNAISITASDVTLDLGGFTISRTTNTPGAGISVGGANCAISNGNIRGFDTGISAQTMAGGRLRGVTVCGFYSVGVNAGEGWRFRDCAALNVTNGAGTLYGFIVGTDARFDHCSAENLSAPNVFGFYTDTRSSFESCIANRLTATAGYCVGINTSTHSTLHTCQAIGNSATASGFGISVGAGSYLTDCVASQNTCSANSGSSSGFWTDSGVTMIGCVAKNNSGTPFANVGRAGMGIYVIGAGLIQNCTVQANSGDGIHVANSSTGVKLINNLLVGNTLCGIRIASGSENVVERNLARGNAYGISVLVPGNLILGNTAGSNNTNFVFAASNRYGPVVDLTAAGAAAVNGNSAASTLGTTDPQANIAF